MRNGSMGPWLIRRWCRLTDDPWDVPDKEDERARSMKKDVRRMVMVAIVVGSLAAVSSHFGWLGMGEDEPEVNVAVFEAGAYGTCVMVWPDDSLAYPILLGCSNMTGPPAPGGGLP